jgi:hypothetical protein
LGQHLGSERASPLNSPESPIAPSRSRHRLESWFRGSLAYRGAVHSCFSREGRRNYVATYCFGGRVGRRRGDGKQCPSWRCLLLPATTNPNLAVRGPTLQLLQYHGVRLRAGVLHRSTNRVLEAGFVRSSDRHLHLAVLRSRGEGGGHA